MSTNEAHVQVTQLINDMNEEVMKSGAELESYLARLDIHQSGRPTQITETLHGISKLYPVESLILLEAYISTLEARSNERVTGSGKTTSTWDIDNPPYWSHERLLKRQQRRQERASKKFTDFS